MAEPAAPAFATLRYEVADAIATITLDRPDALNALTVASKQELLAAFERVAADRSIRAVVLTGAGRAFCSGQDLKERLEPDAAPLDVELRERYNPIIRAMRALDRPIVGAINGIAAGAGASLAFACDLRIGGRERLVPARVRASRADPGQRRDLAAAPARRSGQGRRDGAAHRTPDRCRCRALRAGDTGRPCRPVEGRGAGGGRSPGRACPRALALSKRALNEAWDSSFEEALETEAKLQGQAGSTADHAEGIAAFLEKRPPRFTGK